MIYFDSSALVKRYIKEKGTDIVHSLTARGEAVATSKLTYPEILSAFMRKRREGDLKPESLQSVIAQLENDWGELLIVGLNDELFPLVKSLIQKHRLKAADSIHLASALWLAETAKADVVFIASDETLLSAAKNENLEVINPSPRSSIPASRLLR